MTYLRYDPSLEEIKPDEVETFQKIADSFADMGRKVAEQEGHAVRVSHAKATGLLDGELTIAEGLPEELAQGLAAQPGRYQAAVRFAQGPGEILHDRVSTHRGMSVKLSGLPGDHIPEAAGDTSQDFLLEGSGKAFINSTAATFLVNLKAGVSKAPALPEGVKNVVSKVARGTEAALEAVGLQAKTLDFFGHAPFHPLAEPYFSQVPVRWGDYVGKVGFYPNQATLDSLASLKVDNHDDENAFRSAMLDHFRVTGAEFEMRVQLATDLDTTPIEDASVQWPEDDNPYRTVARLTFAPQEAWTEARNAEFERLSFRPAHSLAAHRPLGQVMRARLFVYEKLVALRLGINGEAEAQARDAMSASA